MKGLLATLLLFINTTFMTTALTSVSSVPLKSLTYVNSSYPVPNCVSFSVSSGTGCAWMCNYCASQLGPNYYFTDNVCTYQSGGCVGNPYSGVTYTCCST